MSSASLTSLVLKPIEIPNIFSRFSNLLSADLAMDLGTANTLIYVRNHGIVLNEPSIVAVDSQSQKPVAVGHRAKEMFGKTAHEIRCIRPMKDGVIADFENASLMIEHFLRQARRGFALRRPRIVIGIPSGITQVEKRAVIDSATAAGGSEIMLVEEPMAAAIGSGLPVDRAVGNMIVDIGGGTTELAIISMNNTLYSQSIRVAGDEMDEAIQRALKKVFSLQVGVFEAERIKMMIGSAQPLGQPRSIAVSGRDLGSGIPRQVEVSDEMIREALEEPLSAIIASVIAALEQTSPEVAHDIVSRGIWLAGGGSLLRGLAERLQRETEIRFHRAQDPLSAVVRGVGEIVENLKDMRVLCIS